MFGARRTVVARRTCSAAICLRNGSFFYSKSSNWAKSLNSSNAVGTTGTTVFPEVELSLFWTKVAIWTDRASLVAPVTVSSLAASGNAGVSTTDFRDVVTWGHWGAYGLSWRRVVVRRGTRRG